MGKRTYLTPTGLKGLLSGSLDTLVREHFIEGIPWYFRNDESLFKGFCDHFCKELSISTDAFCLVGSARIGFAVSPDAFPRPFHHGSDLDVAIVSPELFDEAWFSLVKWGHPRRHTLPAGELRWMQQRQTEIFWGWLLPDHLRFEGLQFPRDLNELRRVRSNWFNAFKSVGAMFPGTDLAGREVSGRLYRTPEHLIRYQAEGLRRLRYRLREIGGQK